jgi:hypothetical protein
MSSMITGASAVIFGEGHPPGPDLPYQQAQGTVPKRVLAGEQAYPKAVEQAHTDFAMLQASI